MSRSGFGRGFDGSVGMADIGSDANVNTITRNVQKINQNMSAIEKMLSKIGTSQDGQRFRDNMEKLERDSSDLIKETNKSLRQLNASAAYDSDRMKKAQVDRLSSEFAQSLTNYQKIAKRIAEAQRENVEKIRASSFGQSTEPLIDTGANQPYTEYAPSGNYPGNSSFQMQAEDAVDLEMIEEREKSIKQLESDIVDVNEIFKDLATMVHDQGEVIDSIEANVESAGMNVTEANTQLQAAVKYQKKSRKKLICIVVLLLIVAAIVGIIIWQTAPKPKTKP
ncbi:Syntaxin-12 [Trichoplax sp. H2]|nr:Syntaxin-12 [Trichoplax sp. H2]|eukprot:RDD47852.1 Syntaxin-12 [Trichoplax sp. H2]